MVFLILVICTNNNHASADEIYDTKHSDHRDNGLSLPSEALNSAKTNSNTNEIKRRDVWSRIFGIEINPSRILSRSHYFSKLYGHPLSNNDYIVIPTDKSIIPIELQKALYAHGIVGRRR